MVFKCQEDSYLKELTTTVKSCVSTELDTVENGKKIKQNGYDIILESTVMFPEGGGQPSDSGWLNDKKVVQLTRRGNEAVHFMLEPMEEGTVVHQKVDWDRRFDHMQQHSGQHLLCAVMEKEFKINTTSWWLGEEESYVEVETTKIPTDVIRDIEKRCNELIRQAVPVNVRVYKKGDPALDEAHTRGLPDDHTGWIRLICIEGVDQNLCCGTHVTNLSELQVIKLLRTEPGKKNKINLKFLVGLRVVNGYQKFLDREQAMTALLKNDGSKHVDLVDKLQKSIKLANKNLRSVLTDIGTMEVQAIKSLNPLPKYACLHRKEGDMDYMKAVFRGFEGIDIFYFVAIGEGKQGGNITMQGDETHIAKLAPQVCEILKGKGAGKGNRYQAKVDDLTGIAKCNALIKSYFDSLPVENGAC